MPVAARALTHAEAAAVEELFWKRVEKSDGCWTWRGDVNRYGYGRLNAKALGLIPTYAHRIAYALFCGDIPAGLTVDHLCRTPPCVNPDHLELVTAQENLRRAGEARLRERVACPKGHPYTYHYVNPNTGHRTRMCGVCDRERARARQRADPEIRRRKRREAYTAARGCQHVAHRGASKVNGQRTDGGWERCTPDAEAREDRSGTVADRGGRPIPTEARRVMVDALRRRDEPRETADV